MGRSASENTHSLGSSAASSDPPATVAAKTSAPKNLLIHGDNLVAAASLHAQFTGAIDLLYLDPPFDVGTNFNVKIGDTDHSTLAYRDKWSAEIGDSYLQHMYERLALLCPLLSPTGSLFVHCDWRSAHHLRALLDELLGRERFRNEIIWAYSTSARGAKAIAKQLARNHDVIFWYTAGDKHVYNPPAIERAYPFAEARAQGFREDEEGRWFKTAPRGDYTDESIANLEAEGRIYRTRTGAIRIKYFLEHRGGRIIEKTPLGDAWFDIPDAMHTQHAERTGYATQKPEALLERIVRMASNEGSLVADFFCGSGVLPAVAQRLNRRWIACDVGAQAMQTTYRRIAQAITTPEPAIANPAGFILVDPIDHEASCWLTGRFADSVADYRQFVVRALGAEFIPHSPFHGLLDGVQCHVLAPFEKLDESRAHVLTDAAVATSAGLIKVLLLGWSFDPGAHLVAAKLRGEGRVDVEFVALPRELINASTSARPTFWMRPKIETSNIASVLRLKRYTLSAINPTEAQQSVIDSAGNDGLALVDGWSVGTAPTATRPYKPLWFSWRDRKKGTLTATTTLAGQGLAGSLAMQVCDIFGHRTLQTIG